MNLHTVSIIVIAAVFLKGIFLPGWYTCVELVAALAALCVLAKVMPQTPKKLKQVELEKMKKVIEGLATEFKATRSKVEKFQLSLGFGDRGGRGRR